MPKSFADVAGDNVLPKKDSVGVVDCLLMSCLVPKSMNLVLSGLINRWFWQHHVATANRSSSNVRSLKTRNAYLDRVNPFNNIPLCSRRLFPSSLLLQTPIKQANLVTKLTVLHLKKYLQSLLNASYIFVQFNPVRQFFAKQQWISSELHSLKWHMTISSDKFIQTFRSFYKMTWICPQRFGHTLRTAKALSRGNLWM